VTGFGVTWITNAESEANNRVSKLEAQRLQVS